MGPQTWHERYKIAKGNLQSPIDIDTAQVEVGENVGPIQFQYTSVHNSTITNDGRNLQVTVTRNNSAVTGGPLPDKYQLAVIRFHWGSDKETGSEHSIDGQKYPLEVQLIHWNKDLYKNIGEAIVGENGLCTIAVLYQISEEDDEGLRPIIELLSRDENKGCFSLEVKSVIDPNEFIRDMTTYWTYQGSLTTPPLTENVTWVVSQNVMRISEEQLKAFRSIKNSSGVPMADHCRPLCPQNERVVRLCTCVVKSPSTENHTDIINYGVVDGNYDEANTVYRNGCNGAEFNAAEKIMHEKHDDYYENGEECNDTGSDAAKDLQDQDGNFHDDEECNAANSDAEKALEDQDAKALQDQDANCHDDEECNGADSYEEKAFQDRDANCHGNNANEDAEKALEDDDAARALQDKDANCHDDEECNETDSYGGKAFQDRDANYHGNDEDGNDANEDVEKTLEDEDAEKALQDEDAYCHGKDDDFNEAKADAKQALQDKDANCHGDSERYGDAEKTGDDIEKARCDENANVQANEKRCDDSLDYGKKLDHLELVDNESDC